VHLLVRKNLIKNHMLSVTGGFFVRFVAFWASVHERTNSRRYSGESDLKDLNVNISIYFVQ
jgi:hypothetical protein